MGFCFFSVEPAFPFGSSNNVRLIATFASKSDRDLPRVSPGCLDRVFPRGRSIIGPGAVDRPSADPHAFAGADRDQFGYFGR
jgi:hypothetical protein